MSPHRCCSPTRLMVMTDQYSLLLHPVLLVRNYMILKTISHEMSTINSRLRNQREYCPRCQSSVRDWCDQIVNEKRQKRAKFAMAVCSKIRFMVPCFISQLYSSTSFVANFILKWDASKCEIIGYPKSEANWIIGNKRFCNQNTSY